MSLRLIEQNIQKLKKFNINYSVQVTDNLYSYTEGSRIYWCMIWTNRQRKDDLIGEYKSFDHIGKLLFYINDVHQHIKVNYPELAIKS